MARTLLGIDLDESPVGGLVERLLDEEDLEKLDARPDGGTGPDSGGPGADDPGDGSEPGVAADGDGDGNGDGDGDEPGSAGTGVDRSPAWRADDAGPATPSPGDAGDDASGEGGDRGGGRIPSLDVGRGADGGARVRVRGAGATGSGSGSPRSDRGSGGFC